MHKLSFPKHVSSTTFLLESIHFDVWGPAPIVFVLEHRFYVIFVDDFTHFTWLFQLKHKSDVFSVFLHFKSLVENQFNTKIKALRSYGGGEFVNKKFKAFCLDNGISYQLSCPYTLQQNEVSERKHRQIVETGLAMLHKTNLPLSYQSYAFSIVVYLLNRISSSVLNFVSPWQKLYLKKPSFQALKVFGCASFPF